MSKKEFTHENVLQFLEECLGAAQMSKTITKTHFGVVPYESERYMDGTINGVHYILSQFKEVFGNERSS